MNRVEVTGATARDERRWSRVRLGLAGATAVVAWTVLLLVDGRSVHAGPTPAGLVVCVLWVLPLVVYVAAVRTRTGSVLLGVGLLAATAVLLGEIYTGDGSTAAVGLLFAPVELLVLAALGVGLDAVGQSLSRRRAAA